MSKSVKKNKKKELLVARIAILIFILIGGFFVALVIWQDAVQPVKKVVTQTQTLATTTTAVIMHGDRSKKQVIFTFDAGGTTESGDEILAVLAKHHVKGTFFMTGKMVENNPDFVKRVAAGGNEIFNHTYNHKDLVTLTNAQVVGELNDMDNTLKALTGLTTRPYFRAPYGSYNGRVLTAAAKDGFQSVFWTEDALDWEEPNGETAAQVKERILNNVAPGTIYLMHVGDGITGAILDEVFTDIESRGYKIVSLTQGL